MQLAAGNGYAVLNSAAAAPAKLNAASAPSVQALELRSETSSPSLCVASQSLELNLRPAPGCRYDVQSQPGPIQQAGAALSAPGDEISIAPAPLKQLGAQSLALGLGIAGLCELPVQSAAGTALPVGSNEALAARTDLRIVALSDGLVKTALNPPMVGIRPLAFVATPCAPSAPQPDTRGVDLIYAANAPNPVKLGAGWPVTPQRTDFPAAFGGTQDESMHGPAMDFWHARDLSCWRLPFPFCWDWRCPSLPKVG
jgi:hypothetical protein